jgi:hypothetical protein
MSQPFDGDFFDFSLVLVLANRAVTVVVAACVCAAQGEPLAPRVPLRGCAAVAAANGAATFCQYEALRFVSFVSVTLAKSAKLLPVLIWARYAHSTHTRCVRAFSAVRADTAPALAAGARRARWCCASATAPLTTPPPRAWPPAARCLR